MDVSRHHAGYITVTVVVIHAAVMSYSCTVVTVAVASVAERQ